jgi:hypothetical protein
MYNNSKMDPEGGVGATQFLAGEGVGGTQFGRLERKPSTLCTLSDGIHLKLLYGRVLILNVFNRTEPSLLQQIIFFRSVLFQFRT